jgi:hypothetical protein
MARPDRKRSRRQWPKEAGEFHFPFSVFFAGVATKWYKQIRSARLVARTLREGP